MSSLPYMSIAYYMQKGEEGLQIACTIAYVINGRPLIIKSITIFRKILLVLHQNCNKTVNLENRCISSTLTILRIMMTLGPMFFSTKKTCMKRKKYMESVTA